LPVSRDIRRDLRVLDELQDPFIRRSLRAAFHLRRYAPLYVAALAGLLVLGVFPSVQDDGESGPAQVAAGADSVGDGGTDDTLATGGETGTTIAGIPAGRGGARVAPVAAKNLQQSLAAAQQASGKTRGGIDCTPGVRQLGASRYAAPCTAAFSGNNGGATAAGVTGDKITIVRRGFPETANSRAIDAVINQAGGAPSEESKKIRDVFIKHFATQFELYGRQIEWVDYESQYGNATDEALSQGREGACADATYIKDTLHAFAVINNEPLATVSAVFAECAAERGMMTFNAAAYYPESWYRRYHPYSWGGSAMECERISYQIAEYIGKRLLNRNAKWAGDPLMQQQKRKFGTYIPDNDEYQSCGNVSRRELETKYGAPKGQPQYNYALDVSRFPDQAAQAIVQFKAAGVTTIVLACDPISTIFLTQAAARQAYYPEWLQIGTALHDVDNAARLFEPTEVDGHLFGPSQLGSTTKLIGKESEPYILYKKLTGKELTEFGATTGEYWVLVDFYSALQSAGPLLSPPTVAEGIFSLPPGGAPEFAVGYKSYQDGSDGTPGGRDHTGIDDAREIFWVGSATSESDGERGTYKETYGGKRFRNGQWPAEEPPIYPS
jgi:hypothetical protein